ncbi:MAG: hypothetical protein ABEJ73_01165 [Haloplanus sp.]
MSDRSPPSEGWRRVALLVGLAAVVVLALLAGGFWLYTDHLYRTSYESGYTYEVAINTNETLENVTLYLPLPADGDVDLGATMVAEGNAAEDAFSYRIVETDSGPMLAVTAERVPVTPRYYEFVESDGQGRRVEIPASEYDPSNPNMMKDANTGTLLTVSVSTDESVATADPWGTEPTFAPRLNRRPTTCDFPTADWLQCYAYDTRVYADYGANATARVDIITTVEGQNAWWVFGWNYDAYRDRIAVTLHGPQDGWTHATGTVEVDVDQRAPPA